MRIRVLELPMEVVGEATSQPFMLIVDRCPSSLVVQQDTRDRLRAIAKEAGARTLLATSEEVELD